MARAPNDVIYCFRVEWYDEQACFARTYLLSYYLVDDTMSMHDVKNNRMFLKRSTASVQLQDLFIGASIHVNGRQLTVVAYGNAFTTKTLSEKRRSVVVALNAEQFGRVGDVMLAMGQRGVQIGRIRSVKLTPAQADKYGDPALAREQAVCAVELIGDVAVDAAKDLLGQDVSGRSSEDDIKFFFATPLATSASYRGTICIIKPHILAEGCEAEIVNIIQREGFKIGALQRLSLDLQAASEFFDIYQDVVPYAARMIKELQSGACIALEIHGEDVHHRFRALCGPSDPEIAKHIRPHTIRANYGKDLVHNAVHCTDLEGDGPLESDFLFSSVQASELIKAGTY